jgi:hypothetical protein
MKNQGKIFTQRLVTVTDSDESQSRPKSAVYGIKKGSRKS